MNRADNADFIGSRRQRATITDWLAEVCKFLAKPLQTADEVLFNGLDEATEKLNELEDLRVHGAPPRQDRPLCYQYISRIKCGSSENQYLGTPTVVNHGPYKGHARCSVKMENIKLYLEQNQEVVFFICRDYKCCERGVQAGQLGPRSLIDNHQSDIDKLLVAEYISIVSPELRAALNGLADTVLADAPHPDFLKADERIQHPYRWWFYGRHGIEAEVRGMKSEERERIKILEQYLDSHVGSEWSKANEYLSRSTITAKYLKYLFVPGEVVISRHESLEPKGFFLKDLATIKHEQEMSTVKLKLSSWSFNGEFELSDNELEFLIPWDEGELPIVNLAVYPKRFADASTIDTLRSRGKTHWRCRYRHFVSSKSGSERTHDFTNHRFMVDMMTYNEMHPPEEVKPSQDTKKLASEVMLANEPDLDDTFFMCLPASIFGFNMHKHEWVTLQVDDLEEVHWNGDAFKYLVLESETKELIQAVVTTRLRAEEHTDIIHGKGNGLFLLLHGGPGTGKTLTAESVAEMARRPLYRVTCGDVGMTVEKVEEYFETVFELCKVWECVVLLDEADVFLEQRSLHHLERNALVSVFLRVLEYYNGILILTTNRIGTFDEAFKSRMHLTLRYKDLGLAQRRQIWTNLIDRLVNTEEPLKPHPLSLDPCSSLPGRSGRSIVDISGIRNKLESLAKVELNGRQIRNAISTAKQLAAFREEPMGYEHLERVIGEVIKFERYIKEVHDDFTPEEIAREKHVR